MDNENFDLILSNENIYNNWIKDFLENVIDKLNSKEDYTNILNKLNEKFKNESTEIKYLCIRFIRDLSLFKNKFLIIALATNNFYKEWFFILSNFNNIQNFDVSSKIFPNDPDFSKKYFLYLLLFNYELKENFGYNKQKKESNFLKNYNILTKKGINFDLIKTHNILLKQSYENNEEKNLNSIDEIIDSFNFDYLLKKNELIEYLIKNNINEITKNIILSNINDLKKKHEFYSSGDLITKFLDEKNDGKINKFFNLITEEINFLENLEICKNEILNKNYNDNLKELIILNCNIKNLIEEYENKKKDNLNLSEISKNNDKKENQSKNNSLIEISKHLNSKENDKNNIDNKNNIEKINNENNLENKNIIENNNKENDINNLINKYNFENEEITKNKEEEIVDKNLIEKENKLNIVDIKVDKEVIINKKLDEKNDKKINNIINNKEKLDSDNKINKEKIINKNEEKLESNNKINNEEPINKKKEKNSNLNPNKIIDNKIDSKITLGNKNKINIEDNLTKTFKKNNKNKIESLINANYNANDLLIKGINSYTDCNKITPNKSFLSHIRISQNKRLKGKTPTFIINTKSVQKLNKYIQTDIILEQNEILNDNDEEIKMNYNFKKSKNNNLLNINKNNKIKKEQLNKEIMTYLDNALISIQEDEYNSLKNENHELKNIKGNDLNDLNYIKENYKLIEKNIQILQEENNNLIRKNNSLEKNIKNDDLKMEELEKEIFLYKERLSNLENKNSQNLINYETNNKVLKDEVEDYKYKLNEQIELNNQLKIKLKKMDSIKKIDFKMQTELNNSNINNLYEDQKKLEEIKIKLKEKNQKIDEIILIKKKFEENIINLASSNKNLKSNNEELLIKLNQIKISNLIIENFSNKQKIMNMKLNNKIINNKIIINSKDNLWYDNSKISILYNKEKINNNECNISFFIYNNYNYKLDDINFNFEENDFEINRIDEEENFIDRGENNTYKFNVKIKKLPINNLKLFFKYNDYNIIKLKIELNINNFLIFNNIDIKENEILSPKLSILKTDFFKLNNIIKDKKDLINIFNNIKNIKNNMYAGSVKFNNKNIIIVFNFDSDKVQLFISNSNNIDDLLILNEFKKYLGI